MKLQGFVNIVGIEFMKNCIKQKEDKMTGMIMGWTEKEKKAGGVYLRVKVESGGSTQEYLCTNPAAMAFVRKNEGNTINFQTFAAKDGSATFMTDPELASGGQPSLGDVPQNTATFHPRKNYQPDNRNASFAASYAKDVTVAAIAAGMITGAKEIDASLLHYNELFLKMLG